MKPISIQENGPESQMKGLNIKANEQATEVFGVETLENISNASDRNSKNTDIPSVGIYNIFWRREDAEHVNKCSIALPGISKLSNIKYLYIDDIIVYF